jgi:hypothetical protein
MMYQDEPIFQYDFLEEAGGGSPSRPAPNAFAKRR